MYFICMYKLNAQSSSTIKAHHTNAYAYLMVPQQSQQHYLTGNDDNVCIICGFNNFCYSLAEQRIKFQFDIV